MKLLRKIYTRLSIIRDRLNYSYNLPKIHVESTDKTLDLIKDKHINVVRFGDGEFDLIEGKSITYQRSSNELSIKLRAILFENNERLLVCVPDFFDDISRYTKASQNFWKHDIRKRKSLYKELANTSHIFGSAQISRPYLNLKDKNMSKKYFEKLKRIWKNKDILIVEGITSRSGVGNDLFGETRSVKRIICPSNNAYVRIKEIEESIRKFKDNRLILLMLGPTAKVIISDLLDIENQMIDIGHVDSEYEWFLRGDLVRTKLPNKHTAEFNSDQNIVFNNDPKYSNEIVAKVL